MINKGQSHHRSKRATSTRASVDDGKIQGLSSALHERSPTPSGRGIHAQSLDVNGRLSGPRAKSTHDVDESFDRRSYHGSHAALPSIIVIDERILVRDCLVRCLQMAYENHVVQAYASLETWKQVAGDHEQPSAIILCTENRRYADSRNADELEFLTQIALTIPVIIISDAEDTHAIMRALKSGARGYIPTSMALEVAVEAVRLVEAGGTFVPASCLMSAREGINTLGSMSPVLTARQIMVARALHSGKANKQIAHELNVCESTVKVHIRHIMRKLNARNRTQIAVKASGLLDELADR